MMFMLLWVCNENELAT